MISSRHSRHRSGWAATRPQARQFVNHGLIQVDGKRVDIASYRVKKGQVLAVIDVPELETELERRSAGIEQADARVKQMEARVRSAEADAKAVKATQVQADPI